MRSIAEWILLSTLLLFVLLTCTLLGVAFHNHQRALDIVQNSTRAEQELLSLNGAGTVEGVLHQLQVARKELFDSNTTTFLFNLLVLTVVNLAVYLHTRSLEGLKLAEKKAQSSAAVASALGPLLEGEMVSSAVATPLFRAERLAIDLAVRARGATGSPAPDLRDAIKAVRLRLQDAADRRIGIERNMFACIEDAVNRIGPILKRVATAVPQSASELIQWNNECRVLLASNDFAGWHDSALANLKEKTEANATLLE
jgi:hypothetical protein